MKRFLCHYNFLVSCDCMLALLIKYKVKNEYTNCRRARFTEMNSAKTNLVKYCIQFRKNNNDIKNVVFNVSLTVYEIDSIAFLFSKYFDQSKYVAVKGLTFFSEFNKCVETVKRNFDSKQQNNDIKQLFSVFLKHEFMNQVPNFRKIMQYLQKYLKAIETPSIMEIGSSCDKCSVNELKCLSCKINYVSASVTMFDKSIQDGWDIFLRPMFGLPIFMYILLKTDYDHNGIFNADDLMTNSFALFFRNLLSDKASQYVNQKSVQPLVNECRRLTAGLNHHELEYLLCMLRNRNTCDTVLFAPFKNFIFQMACKTKIKQAKINKIASVIFTGFYLRLYIDGALTRPNNNNGFNNHQTLPFKQYAFGNTLVFDESKSRGGNGNNNNNNDNNIINFTENSLTPFELELRNVCRFILPKYTHEQFEKFIGKLAAVKRDLSIEQYIVTEKQIRQLVNKHNLDEDFSVLLNQNV
ncbi:P48/p45 [Trabala vishnou gigantina nucleopolyhedrovirus]|uniref:P48/p45 n=1 Tax=Trabala vishnou gigantina nucleopolyhedrovirus TaxID=2863583 RepID=UPI0024819B87|nr:P48/p45 [Trabala vishnou gigantina nucleopolyhedrovirus]QYC92672.1 P48/p45 [Trabala vishnou gigantina nucleopolyhedrovirus]